MVKNYWIKQGFFLLLFLFCEVMIALALISSRHYLGLVLWCLHIWPVLFMVYLLRKKMSDDIGEFVSGGIDGLFDKGLENLISNIKPQNEEHTEDGTKGPSAD